ncbi:MAG: class I SAM-dependent methyltransferase [Gammaproteobacteria bacterium]|nr:MAG: class I SAM-dependent methyltransferase [Gammaproteobacteria bacterium]
MANTRAFDENARAYDDWFEDHRSLYESELEAIRSLMPDTGYGIEMGVGSGRFAEPLGIRIGIEPSPVMRTLARDRGINAIGGIAEKLPLKPETFDYVLFVTTVCFLTSLSQAFGETFRILKPQGLVVIGFIEKESTLGRDYQLRKAESRFYRDASFHTAGEIIRVLKAAGFTDFSFVQTLFSDADKTGAVQAVKEGYGDGAFVVVRAKKTGRA